MCYTFQLLFLIKLLQSMNNPYTNINYYPYNQQQIIQTKTKIVFKIGMKFFSF